MTVTSKTFVVGTPRSGTTLMQSVLAAHPSVFATRETHWMVKVRRPSSPAWLLDYLWLDPKRVQGALAYLKEHCPKVYDQYEAQPVPCRHLAEAARALDTLFTRAAQAQQKTAWVEKSPEHGGYAPVLERALPDIRFVHTIRDPRDNVASLYDAGQRYAERWPGRQTLAACIQTYKNYLEKSRACLRRDPQRHLFVVYERMIEEPEAQTQRLMDFAGLRAVSLDLANLDSGSASLTGAAEGWKREQAPGIQDTRLVKYNRLFDKAQQQQVEDETMELYEQTVADIKQ